MFEAASATLSAHARDTHVRPGARILDVGARVMPYYPLFAETADDYVGNDLEPGP